MSNETGLHKCTLCAFIRPGLQGRSVKLLFGIQQRTPNVQRWIILYRNQCPSKTCNDGSASVHIKVKKIQYALMHSWWVCLRDLLCILIFPCNLINGLCCFHCFFLGRKTPQALSRLFATSIYMYIYVVVSVMIDVKDAIKCLTIYKWHCSMQIFSYKYAYEQI